MPATLPPTYDSIASSSSLPPRSQLAAVPATKSKVAVQPDEITLIVSDTSGCPPDYPDLSPYPAQTLVTRLTDLLDDQALLGGKGGKASLDITLVEAVCFVTPPTVSYDASGAEFYSDEGKGDRISGVIRVSLPSRRNVEHLRVRLGVAERLAFPGETLWEDRNLLEKELVYRGEKSNPNDPKSKGFWMEAGVTSFEFSFAIPAWTPGRDVSPAGRILCHVQATVLGFSGILFKSKLEDRKECFIYVNPYPSDPAAFQFSFVSEGIDPYLGSRKITLLSNTFTVASPITITLALTDLPPNLTIYTISAFCQQTTMLTSSKVPNKTAQIVGPKRIIAHQGPKSGFAQEGFAKRARAEGGDAVVLDVEKAGLAGGSWTWSRLSRMPTSHVHRPTTPKGSKTGLRLSTELTVEVFYSLDEDEAVRVVPIFHRKVELASCFCTDSFHKLPDYSDSTIHRVPLHGHPEEIGCACDLSWPVLEAREKAVLERLQMEADLGMAKRLHHELNSSRFATDGDGVEGEGMKDGAWADERWKVGELDDAVWRE